MPPYFKNSDGSIKEWAYEGLDDFNYHQHLSHLYPVFPGTEVSTRKNRELQPGLQLAVQKRVLGSQKGWGMAHMSCLYCRLGQQEKATECLDILTRSCLLSNFLRPITTGAGWVLPWIWEGFTTIQLDALMGLVNAVQEILLYADERYIKIPPSRPECFMAGKISSFCFPGGSVSLQWAVGFAVRRRMSGISAQRRAI